MRRHHTESAVMDRPAYEPAHSLSPIAFVAVLVLAWLVVEGLMLLA
jgi:hypothetical protein